MSSIGTRFRNGRLARLIRGMPAGHDTPRTEQSQDNTPYWLLWISAAVASVLCAAAFVLWGITGASTLFDMIVAFCT